jgi:hypothetical protein
MEQLTKPYTALSIAVSSGKIGCVYMVDGELCDWSLSKSASKSETAAVEKVSKWLDRYQPDNVITERLSLHTRKRGRTVRNINAIDELVEERAKKHIRTIRLQRFGNKYEEIGALAKRYPAIANWAPKKRKLWETEMPETVLFEALSIVKGAL